MKNSCYHLSHICNQNRLYAYWVQGFMGRTDLPRSWLKCTHVIHITSIDTKGYEQSRTLLQILCLTNYKIIHTRFVLYCYFLKHQEWSNNLRIFHVFKDARQQKLEILNQIYLDSTFQPTDSRFRWESVVSRIGFENLPISRQAWSIRYSYL